MLQIYRIIPVGGVSLAILVLVLALSPPDAFRPPLPAIDMPARGALLTRDQHPEWRQFLFETTLRRADELKQLRQLPDKPLPSALRALAKRKAAAGKPKTEMAAVPIQQNTVGGQDTTGSIVPSPDASTPVGIGESSSSELPVMPQRKQQPVIMMPAHNEAPPNPSIMPTQTPKPIMPMHAKANLNAAPAKTKAPAKPAQAIVKVKAIPTPTKPVLAKAKVTVKSASSKLPHASQNGVVPRAQRTRLAAAPPAPADFNPLAALFGIDTRANRP